MTRVPISRDDIDFVRLDLSHHYFTVDCDFQCFIVVNASAEIPYQGTDIKVVFVGSWQFDSWAFLTKKEFPNDAGFNAYLVWDKTQVREGYNAPRFEVSDIDGSNSVSSLKGQPVNITGFSIADGGVLPVETIDKSYVSILPYAKGYKVSVGDTITDFVMHLMKIGSYDFSDSGNELVFSPVSAQCMFGSSFFRAPVGSDLPGNYLQFSPNYYRLVFVKGGTPESTTSGGTDIHGCCRGFNVHITYDSDTKVIDSLSADVDLVAVYPASNQSLSFYHYLNYTGRWNLEYLRSSI